MDTSTFWTICANETDKKVVSENGDTLYLVPVTYSPEIIEQVLAEAAEWEIEIHYYYEYEYGHASVGYNTSSSYMDIPADEIIVQDGHFVGTFHKDSFALITHKPAYGRKGIKFYYTSEKWCNFDRDRSETYIHYLSKRRTHA